MSAPATGLPLRSCTRAAHVKGRAGRGRAQERAAVGDARHVHAPERPQQIGRGFALAVVAVVEQADELGDADRARHHGRFVVRIVRGLADAIDDGERRLEFRLGQFHVADELVEMGRESDHDLAQPRVGRLLHLGENDVRQVAMVFDDHGISSRRDLIDTDAARQTKKRRAGARRLKNALASGLLLGRRHRFLENRRPAGHFALDELLQARRGRARLPCGMTAPRSSRRLRAFASSSALSSASLSCLTMASGVPLGAKIAFQALTS